MKLFGTLSELVKVVFRSGGRETKLDADTQTGSQTDVTFRLPDLVNNSGSAVVATIVEKDLAQTLTNKIINGSNNTISNIGYGSLSLTNSILNADIASTAAIVDTKLATISTAGKVSNSATTATNLNTASAIVARDASGDFSAGTITASLSGNVTGNVTGNVSGTAGNITATSNSTLTTLSALSLPGSQVSGNISGNAANVTGTVAIANGGTGQTTQQAALTALAGTQTSGQYLRSDGTNTLLSTIQAGDVPTLNQNTTGTAANVTGIVAVANGGSGQTTANAALNAFLPSQSTSANKYLKTDGTNTSWASASGGAGEINAILNSSGADGITGWVAGTSHTTPTVITGVNNPLDPIVSTAFSFTASAGTAVASSGQEGIGIYDDITLPTALQNRKLKIEFSYSTPASSTGTWAVVLYQGSTKVSLSTNTGATPDTVLPSGVTGGKFTAYFDSINASAYRLLLVQRTRTSANTLYLTNVIMGPGIQPQGAVVGEWVGYTPSISAGFGTATNINFKYRRVGDSVEIEGSFTAGTVAASTGSFRLPGTFTLDTTKIPNISAVTNLQGGWFSSGSTSAAMMSNNRGGAVAATSSDTANLYFAVRSSTAALLLDNVSGQICASGDTLFVRATAPIAEWAGSGTVQLAQNDVEYASNNGNVTGAGLSDTSSFVYGPNGTAFLAYNSITNSGFSTTKFRVQFQTPIQATDVVQLEVLPPSSSTWLPFEKALVGYFIGNTAIYGARLVQISSTQVNVEFGNAGQGMGGISTVGAAGDAWSSLASAGWRWRVRKTSAGAAVGFGIVQPGTSAGLVSASGLPGNTTGNPIASGYVGESLTGSGSSSSIVTNAPTTIATVPLPSAGIWRIVAVIRFSNNASGTTWTSGNDNYGYISDTTNSSGTGGDALSQFNIGGAMLSNVAYIGVLRQTLQRTVITTGAKNYFIVAQCIFTGGIPSVAVAFEAIRIA